MCLPIKLRSRLFMATGGIGDSQKEEPPLHSPNLEARTRGRRAGKSCERILSMSKQTMSADTIDELLTLRHSYIYLYSLELESLLRGWLTRTPFAQQVIFKAGWFLMRHSWLISGTAAYGRRQATGIRAWWTEGITNPFASSWAPFLS